MHPKNLRKKLKKEEQLYILRSRVSKTKNKKKFHIFLIKSEVGPKSFYVFISLKHIFCVMLLFDDIVMRKIGRWILNIRRYKAMIKFIISYTQF